MASSLGRRARSHERGRHAAARRTDVVEYIAFLLGSTQYALPVASIREIVRPPPITPVPRAGEGVLGIVSVRGRVISVFDPKVRLRTPVTPMTQKSRIVITEVSGERVGLLVDEVTMVYRLSDSEIEETGSGADGMSIVVGIARPAEVAPTQTVDPADSEGAELRAVKPIVDTTPGERARAARVETALVLLLLDPRALVQ